MAPLKVLRQRRPVGTDAMFPERVFELPNSGHVRPTATHERIAARTAKCVITVGAGERQTLLRKPVQVGSHPEGEVVRASHHGTHVVDHYKQHVFRGGGSWQRKTLVCCCCGIFLMLW